MYAFPNAAQFHLLLDARRYLVSHGVASSFVAYIAVLVGQRISSEIGARLKMTQANLPNDQT